MSTGTQFRALPPGFDARRVWLTRQTFAWASYDVASSVYFGVAPAVLLPIYFRHLMSGYENPTSAWGLLAAVAILASSIAALGAAIVAPRLRRFPLLVALSAGLTAAIAVLAWNPRSSLLLAGLAYVAAQSLYFAAMTVYESFLPDLLPSRARHKLSGFGWALGYLGGVVAIVVLLRMLADHPESPQLLETCFAVLALIGALLFAVAFVLMARAGFGRIGGAGARPRLPGLLDVLVKWRQQRSVFLLLLATMLVHAAVSVVVVFTAPILASRFGQDLQDLLWLLLLIHVLSVPSTFGWSLVMDRWERKVPMTLLFLAWGVVLLLLAFASAGWMPVATVSVIGCC
ncbi:hypothetical protein, partial [Aestuariivirga sp.]|uniref:hypothetical protein n=1 Tax=Aestuariivirga sp. TaxID=2650926 RepID=UPI00391BE3E3